ncbi:Methionine--tRNA ligase [Candidatus Micrarchaeum sp.]|uniref:hypothetical protein n=1 Tax=Candidatus Micrarchaeum sp. TaxID=2282148 RepID=UPI000AEC4B32|nr:hypothetical protein [Candidatus Micrarchaeum sp.]QRF74035.1 Methionine--tRNA ligase [Candidatus Micrarchaeum sp.]
MRNNRDLDSIMGDINESEEHERNGSDDSVEAIGDKNDSFESDDDNGSIMSVSEYERISFDKFEAVDLRVAKILDAEVHQSTRKPMYKLTLDLGELGKRTIVAGIGAFYGRDELIGKKIVVVANLAPRTIAGVVSDGMLLAAEDELNVSLIVPDKDAAPGSRIH